MVIIERAQWEKGNSFLQQKRRVIFCYNLTELKGNGIQEQRAKEAIPGQSSRCYKPRDQHPAFASETQGSHWRGHVGWTKPVQGDTGQTLPNENKELF